MRPAPEQESMDSVVLELLVNNHPGVMSHICGLFSRRAFNMEGIACLPVGDGSRSRIWLLVGADQRLDQVVKQVRKLRDVLQVDMHGGEHPVFTGLGRLIREGGSLGQTGPLEIADQA
jgi:acetolactate synthase I/III small subunit